MGEFIEFCVNGRRWPRRCHDVGGCSKYSLIHRIGWWEKFTDGKKTMVSCRFYTINILMESPNNLMVKTPWVSGVDFPLKQSIHWIMGMLNFTRSWVFGIFRIYWVSKSKCIISSNLRAEGSWGKVLNVVILVESVVHRSNWRSREIETVGNSRKQSETVGNSRERPGVIMPKLSIRHFFCKKNFSAQSHFFFESATGNSWKQLGLVPLTRPKKSYLKQVYKENEP